MVLYQGRQVYCLVGKETTWGTAVTTNKDVGLVQNLTLTGDLNYTRAHTVGDVDTQDISSGRADLTGSLEVMFQHGRLLEYLVGTVTHAETTGDWRHTFALAETLSSLTLGASYDGSTDIKETWKGVKTMSGTLALALDGYLRLRTDLSFKDIDPSGTTADTASISALKPFKDFFATLSFGAAGSETALGTVQSFEFTLNNAGVGDPKIWGLESKLPAALDASGRIMDFRFSMAFQSVTEFNRFLGSTTGVLDSGTEIAASGLIFNINNNVTLGSGRRDLYLDLSDVYLTRISKPVPLGAWVIVDFDGFAKTVDSFYSTDNISNTNW